jgi:hypothetical protein
MWPDGKSFAFSIIDDTDSATIANVREVYRCLLDHGIRTTKTVWCFDSPADTPLEGDTLDSAAHRDWLRELQDAGVEVGYHGASAAPSARARSLAALERFREVVGHYPRTYASHSGQLEAMYWGPGRFSGGWKNGFSIGERIFRPGLAFSGDVEGSPYFWGDHCRDKIEYVRNLTFNDINTLKCDPLMPYHDPAKPYVRYWFSASNAPQAKDLVSLLSTQNLTRLAEEGGACIVYSHFAYGYMDGQRVDSGVKRAIEALSRMNGWFVPVAVLLDHLRSRPGWQPKIDQAALQRMQARWFWENSWGKRAKLMRRLRRRLFGAS